MTFYIEPPTGHISLEHLETFATKRLEFLIDLFSVRENSLRKGFGEILGIERVSTSDCLIEGTQKDIISHFILRICLSSDSDAAIFLQRAEGHLFRLRTQSFTEAELSRFLRKTETQLQRLVKTKASSAGQSALDIMLQIKGDYSWKSVARLCKMESVENTFSVTFVSALKLLAQRDVILNCGMALVPYKFLRDVLVQCFDDFLRKEIKDINSRNSVEDVRIKRLSYKLKYILSNWMAPRPDYDLDLPFLKAVDLEAESRFFPPCMKQLFNRLHSVHRLRHHTRIQLTLFLKEIGMPIYEALQFWRSEYSKMSTSSENRCRHHWEQHSRRYTYNIRHLYGLEGSKINYRGHCCLSLQGCMPGPGDCGGCPLRHSDQEHLNQTIEDLSPCDRDTVVSLCKNGRYSTACGTLLQERLRIHKETTVLKETQSGECYENGKIGKNSRKRKRSHLIKLQNPVRSDVMKMEVTQIDYSESKTGDEDSSHLIKLQNPVRSDMMKMEVTQIDYSESKTGDEDSLHLIKLQNCDNSDLKEKEVIQINYLESKMGDEDSSHLIKLQNCDNSDMTNMEVTQINSLGSKTTAEESFVENCETKCYDHELCYSQLCCSQKQINAEYGEEINIAKPSDFYFRLKQYLDF